MSPTHPSADHFEPIIRQRVTFYWSVAVWPVCTHSVSFSSIQWPYKCKIQSSLLLKPDLLVRNIPQYYSSLNVYNHVVFRSHRQSHHQSHRQSHDLFTIITRATILKWPVSWPTAPTVVVSVLWQQSTTKFLISIANLGMTLFSMRYHHFWVSVTRSAVVIGRQQ